MYIKSSKPSWRDFQNLEMYVISQATAYPGAQRTASRPHTRTARSAYGLAWLAVLALLAVLAWPAVPALLAVPTLLAVPALLAVLALLAAGAPPASPTLLTAGAPPTVLAPLHPRSARDQRLARGATERLKQSLELRFRAYAQLGVGVFCMGVYGVLAHVETPSDGGFTATLGDKHGDLGLAFR